jgi:tetratricopeptide (TPR) repeat protein
VVSRMLLAHNAATLRFRGDRAGYIAAVEQIRKTYPPDDYLPALTQELGFANIRAGRVDDAIRAFRSVIELDKTEGPKTSNLLILADLYAAKGDTTTAESIFQDIIARYPNSDVAGTAKQRLSMRREALVALTRRVVEPEPESSPRPVAASSPATKTPEDRTGFSSPPASDPSFHPPTKGTTGSNSKALVLGACAAGAVLLVLGGLYLVRKRATTPGRLPRS